MTFPLSNSGLLMSRDESREHVSLLGHFGKGDNVRERVQPVADCGSETSIYEVTCNRDTSHSILNIFK